MSESAAPTMPSLFERFRQSLRLVVPTWVHAATYAAVFLAIIPAIQGAAYAVGYFTVKFRLLPSLLKN